MRDVRAHGTIVKGRQFVPAIAGFAGSPDAMPGRVGIDRASEFLIVAHQGAGGPVPPNSLAAFERACLLGAKAIECDVYLVEGELVVIHPEGFKNYVDPAGLKRWSNIPTSLEKLRSIQVNGMPLVPTLAEVCTLVAGRAELQIELKGPHTTKPTARYLLDCVAAGTMSIDDFLLMSFEYPEEPIDRLTELRSISPQFRLGLSIRSASDIDDAINKAMRLKIEMLDMPRREVTPEIVAQVHRAGLHLTAYHARTADEIARCATLGLDSVRTDIFCGPELTDYSFGDPLERDLVAEFQSLGIYRLTDRIADFVTEIRDSLKTQGLNNLFPRAQTSASLIPSQSVDAQPGTNLVLDIGGTSVKAGIRVVDPQGQESWQFLFEVPHAELSTDEFSGNSYERFCHSISKLMYQRFVDLKLDLKTVENMAVVWSNLMQPVRSENGHLDAQVVRTPVSYRKGEPFVRDLQQGDLVGAPLLLALADAGFTLNQLVVANDVPLIMTAGNDVDGAVVASTGVNGTLLQTVSDDGAPVILNGELGRFLLPEAYLSEGDKLHTHGEFHIGHAISGRYLPGCFMRHLDLMAKKGGELGAVSRSIHEHSTDSEHFFQMQEIAALANGDLVDFQRQLEQRGVPVTEDQARILHSLARELVVRAGRLAGFVAFVTVATDLEAKDHFEVAVDSRLAREMPLFKSGMEEQFHAILHRLGKTGNLQHLKPLETEAGAVSIAMLGAARALDRINSSVRLT